MSAAAIFQLSWPSDRIGTNTYATTVPTVVAIIIWTKQKANNVNKTLNQCVEKNPTRGKVDYRSYYVNIILNISQSISHNYHIAL